MRSTLIFLFTLSSCYAIAQQQEIDSLLLRLPLTTGLEELQSIHYNLGYDYIDVDNSKGIYFSKKAFEMSWTLGDSLKIVKAGVTTAMAYRRLEMIDSGLTILFRVMPVAKRNHFTQAEGILRGISLSFVLRGHYDLALKYSFEALECVEQDENLTERYVLYNNIGLIYYKLHNLEKAKEYFNQALDIASSEDVSVSDKPILHTNLALTFCDEGSFDKVNESLKQALLACASNCEPRYLMHIRFAEGAYHSRLLHFDSALFSFQSSYSLSDQLDAKRFRIINLLAIAELFIKQRKLDDAFQYLIHADSLLLTTTLDFEKLHLYQQFVDYYSAEENSPKLIQYQKMYIDLRDQIYSRSMLNNLVEIENEFSERRNLKEIQTQRGLIKSYYTIGAMASVIILLLVGMVYLLYRSNKRGREFNILLEEKIKTRTSDLLDQLNQVQKEFSLSQAANEKSIRTYKRRNSNIASLATLLANDNGEVERQQEIAVRIRDLATESC